MESWFFLPPSSASCPVFPDNSRGEGPGEGAARATLRLRLLGARKANARHHVTI